MSRMATLHVRKVPDYLYEAIRERAEREGRSIGGEVICLLEETLLAQGLRRRRGLLEPFAEDGRQAVVLAQEEARELALRESLAARSGSVDSGHVLVGLARVEEGVAARMLTRFGADLDTLRQAVILHQTGGGSFLVRAPEPEGEDRYRVLELTG